jgi:serine/threonine protein phosphatase PrpC
MFAEADRMFEEALRALRRAVWSEGREGRAWVAGKEPDGQLLVQIEVDGTAWSMKVPDMRILEGLIGPQLHPTREEVAVPYAPRTLPTLPAQDHTGPTPAVLAGGAAAQDRAMLDRAVVGRLAVAGYTCRGPTRAQQGIEYKSFNEDAMMFRGAKMADGADLFLLGAFDQAGGEGRIEESPGAGSEAAARAVDAVFDRIAGGEDPAAALTDAVAAADDAVRDLGVGAVCTLAVAVVIAREGSAKAWTAIVGDSRVLRVGPGGELLAATVLHNLGAQVAAGQAPGVHPAMAIQFASGLSRGLGGDDASPDLDVWDLGPGDRIVAATDGLGDAREGEEMPTGTWHADRCADHLARILGGSADVADSVTSLVGYALDQASEGYGKPDNIGVVVLAVT